MLESSGLFLQALQALDAQYDPNVCLIKTPFSSPGYHTTLDVAEAHPTLQSLRYAVACLDAGDESRRERADAILRRVLPLQDTNPEHDTYGIWPWFYEEPLERMAPPDWNWADFCGTQLLQIVIDHRDRLDVGLMELVDAAIGHACRSIIRRNVTLTYTNIAIMGTYVTLVAGERLGWPEVEAYGRERLRRFAEFTLPGDAFIEYNSPTYTRVAISELSRLRRHVQSPDARGQVTSLHDFAWRHLARHFHAPTRQWAGPHCRSYSDLQGEEFLSFLQWSSGGRLAYLPDDAVRIQADWPRLGYEMPADVLEYFAPLQEPHTVHERYRFSGAKTPDAVSTTYLHPGYCLGSISHADFWNQRRALIGYWGTPDEPSFLRLRLLHDGYDFASGFLFATQQDGKALAIATMVTDNGDTHCILDPIRDLRLRFTDLRLRLEIGGAAAGDVRTAPWDGRSPLHLLLAGQHVTLHVPVAECAGYPITGCILAPADAARVLRFPPGAHAEADAAAVDLVLYHGPEITVEMPSLAPVAIGLALQIGESADPAPPAGRLHAGYCQLTLGALELIAPAGPCATAELLEKRYTA